MMMRFFGSMVKNSVFWFSIYSVLWIWSTYLAQFVLDLVSKVGSCMIFLAATIVFISTKSRIYVRMAGILLKLDLLVVRDMQVLKGLCLTKPKPKAH